MATYLERIASAHRAAAQRDGRSLADLIEAAHAAPPVRPFAPSLEGDGLSVIAEIKRRSPSLGDLSPGLVPGVLAKAYAAGRAACLSVLTDCEFFGAEPDDLAQARAAVDLPVLRKDFTVSARDVCDARIMGADAVLLIAAILDDDELAYFHQMGRRLGMDVLVEVHQEGELERALRIGATLVGINQRDLVTFEVDSDRAVRMAAAVPEGVVKVAESGIRGRADAERLHQAGYDAVLVGESLVRSTDPTSAVEAMRCT